MNFNGRKISVALCALLLSTSSMAVPISCDAGIASNVSSTSGCQLGSTNNDFLNPLQVNVDEMFGYDDWQFGQKAFDNAMDIDFGLSTLGGAISGSWSINNIWTSYSDIMLVFKGGAGNNTVTTYVGYLLTQNTISGTYLSPFANPINGNLKGISHISIYARGFSVVVAEPATFLMLLIGLFGIGVARTHNKH